VIYRGRGKSTAYIFSLHCQDRVRKRHKPHPYVLARAGGPTVQLEEKRETGAPCSDNLW